MFLKREKERKRIMKEKVQKRCAIYRCLDINSRCRKIITKVLCNFDPCLFVRTSLQVQKSEPLFCLQKRFIDSIRAERLRVLSAEKSELINQLDASLFYEASRLAAYAM